MFTQYNQKKQTNVIEVNFPAKLAHLKVLHLKDTKIINKIYEPNKCIKLYRENMLKNG